MDTQSSFASYFLGFQFLIAFLLPVCGIIATISLVVLTVQQVKIAKQLKQILIELEKKNNT